MQHFIRHHFGLALLVTTALLAQSASAVEPVNKAEFILEGSGMAPGVSSVATNGNGTFLSIWYKNNEIWGQYSERGNLTGSEFPVVTSDNNIDTARDLRLVMNTSGDAVAFWVGTDNKLHAQRIPAGSTAATLTLAPIVASKSGVPVSSETELTVNPDNKRHYGREYEVAMDDAGNFYTLTRSYPVASKFDASNAYQGEWQAASTGTSNTCQWSFSFFVSKYLELELGTGKKWVTNNLTQYYTDISNACMPSMAINSKGNMAIAYTDGSSVYISRHNLNAPAATDFSSIALAYAHGESYDANISSTGATRVTNLYSPTEVAVAIDENDNIVVAWVNVAGTYQTRTDSDNKLFNVSSTINAEAYVNNGALAYKLVRLPYAKDSAAVGFVLAKKPATIFNNLRMTSNNVGVFALSWTQNFMDAKQSYQQGSPYTGVKKSSVAAQKYTYASAIKPAGPVVAIANASKAVKNVPNYVINSKSDIALDDAGSLQVNWERRTSTDGVVAPNAMARFVPGKGVK